MTTTPAPASTPALDRFFATLRRSPVTRSQNRAVAGVCGGIAERLGVSTAIVRVGMVVLAILGPALALYLLAWLMLPDSQGQIRLERAIRAGDGSSIAMVVFAALAIASDLFGHNMGGHHVGPWPFIAIAAVVVVGFKKGWWQRHREAFQQQRQNPSTPASPTSTPDDPQDAPRV